SLPQFPYREFANTSNINFYLRPAGTINITAVNSTGNRITFRYQVKDTKLGYPIASEFNNSVSEAIVYVPRDRNYSIMIYPNQAMPVSFNWNNFTSNSSYTIVTGLSTYNATTHTVQKTFNSTDNLIRLTGYIQNLTGNDFADWNEFTVVPYLLEPGNMIYLGDNAGMPYNMSAWDNTCVASVINQTNAYINSTGYQLTPAGKNNYNITAIWSNNGGAYNISVSLANATTSASGLVTNASAANYSNVSLSYTYNTACSDTYNLTTGFYNITLPGPAESATYILFATAKNGTNYYGGYKNITLNYSSSSNSSNFTMYRLMSTGWGLSNNNITLNDAVAWSKVNISSAKQQFNLVNSSNNTISNINAHLEIKVDYTNYNATEFTFMTDISSASGSFYLPLLNASVKEINIFSQSYSPKRVPTKTAAQILSNSNITMSTFNPGDIDGSNITASVQIALYKSNSTCDLPDPSASCIIADSASMDPNAANSFNPLSSIIGGGKLNFRMGLLSSEIIVEYINVDMLASGPPDALFDDSTTNSTTGGFSSAMRFGSNGPTIYDYVLISMPYTEGNTSTTGLNENADVNMSIPILYDENWNIIWNATANGTNGSALAGNNSHYSTYSSQWQTLMGQNNCTKNQSFLNSTTPCYINTSSNRIWIRLPHFSGTKPSVVGSVITATSTSTTSTTTSSSGSSIVSKWVKEIKINGSELNLGQTLKILKKNYRITFNVSGMGHSVGITNITSTSVTIEVASTPQTATLLVGETKKFDVTDDGYYDLSIKLNSINNSNSASLTILSINEKIPAETTAAAEPTGSEATDEVTPEKSLTWLWIIIVIIIILIAGSIWYYINKRNVF
ncbi:MAG: hypothetical protein Q8N63_04885, partial [Nanoarchaeota archaeon]|nr:hypothetical protein [Nanoarchaeota archaeon]